MKIAIIGDHPYAELIGEYLDSIGASTQRYANQGTHKKALRVQKRFHSRDEGTSKQRFQDVFRVIFEQDPEAEISKQLSGEGKEVFEKLVSFVMELIVNFNASVVYAVFGMDSFFKSQSHWPAMAAKHGKEY